MNKESNIFTFSFAIIMVLIVGTILAVTSEFLMPQKLKKSAAQNKYNGLFIKFSFLNFLVQKLTRAS